METRRKKNRLNLILRGRPIFCYKKKKKAGFILPFLGIPNEMSLEIDTVILQKVVQVVSAWLAKLCQNKIQFGGKAAIGMSILHCLWL